MVVVWSLVCNNLDLVITPNQLDLAKNAMVRERRSMTKTSASTVMVRKCAKRRRLSMLKSIKVHLTTKLTISMVKLMSILVLKLAM